VNDRKIENKELLLRLRKVEGQLRGIQDMIANERYYLEIIYQLNAVQTATKNTAFILLERHLNECIENAKKSGNLDEEMNNIIIIFKQFTKYYR